jgi:SAM-dependent methyltransferase
MVPATMQQQGSTHTTPPDPAPIFEMAGFMAAKHLFAATELGVFEQLAGGPAGLDELAQRLGIPKRTARIAADAMSALGLLVRDDEGRYANGEAAQAFLGGAGPADLRPFMRFWDRISYPNWQGLAASLRSGTGATIELSDEESDIFSAGVEAITAGSAHALAESYELDRHERLLDVGGGTGSFLFPALRANPNLRATLVEIDPVVRLARTRVEEAGLGARISVVEADILEGPLPDGHDAVLLANVVHLFSPEHNRDLLRRLREEAAPGARLLLVDFWTDPSHTEPAFAALMAGEFTLVSGEGDVYSEQELRGWLEETGWQTLDRRPLAGPQTLVVAEAA